MTKGEIKYAKVRLAEAVNASRLGCVTAPDISMPETKSNNGGSRGATSRRSKNIRITGEGGKSVKKSGVSCSAGRSPMVARLISVSDDTELSDLHDLGYSDWDSFTRSIDEAERLAQPESFDHLHLLTAGYGQVGENSRNGNLRTLAAFGRREGALQLFQYQLLAYSVDRETSKF